jgi:hypothetical protein
MDLWVQWTKNPPEDWEVYTLGPTGAANRRWQNSPKKPRLSGGIERDAELDSAPGYIYDLALFGVWLGGMDVYSAEILGSGQNYSIRVTCWNDDPAQYPVGERWGRVTTFLNARTSGRPSGYPFNIEQAYYAEPNSSIAQGLGWRETPSGLAVPVHPWSELVMPAENLRRYGVQVSDELAAAHTAVRQPIPYTGWV